MNGSSHEGFLPTLAERKCEHLLMHPLGSKKADAVTTAITAKLWPFVAKVRSLTMHNGKEFRGTKRSQFYCKLEAISLILTPPGSGVRTSIQMV